MRITEKALRTKIDYLNKITGNPPTPYTRNGATLKTNIGSYYLNGVYRGWTIAQIANEGGGIHSLLFGQTKSELYYQLEALIQGILIGKELRP